MLSTEQADLQRLVTTMLLQSGYEPLGRVQCRVENGVVELSGCVPTFYLKQLSQAIVLRIDRVKEVRNLVEVS